MDMQHSDIKFSIIHPSCYQMVGLLLAIIIVIIIIMKTYKAPLT